MGQPVGYRLGSPENVTMFLVGIEWEVLERRGMACKKSKPKAYRQQAALFYWMSFSATGAWG